MTPRSDGNARGFHELSDRDPKAAYDAIVVGTGHNGLTAAFYIASAGLRVAMFERRVNVGGMCSTEEVFPGYRNNRGANSAHNLDPKVVDDMKLGSFGLQWAQRNPSAIMPFPDGRIYVGWNGRKQSMEQIEKFGKGDAEGYYRLLEELDELAEALDVSYYDPPPEFRTLASRLTTKKLEDTFRKVMFGSATTLLRDRIKSEQVIATLGMIGVSGNFISPSTPGSALMLFARPMYRGSPSARLKSRGNTLGTGPRSPIGGMGAITDAMARSLASNGVEIFTNAGVRQVVCADGQVTGVVLDDGREVAAPVVVSNMSPKATLLELIPSGVLDSDVVERAQEIRMTGSVFKVLLGVDGLPTFRGTESKAEDELFARCGYRMGPSIASLDEAYQQAIEGGWSREPIIWGLTPSTIDPSMAPPGKHVMSLTTFHAPRYLGGDATWATEKEKFGKTVIRLLDDYMPGLEARVENYKFLSPEDLESEYGLLGGSQTHGDVTPGQMFSNRPMVGCSDYRTPVRGLYMCSVGTWPAYYVSGLPGHNAGHQVLADLALTEPERGARFEDDRRPIGEEEVPIAFAPS